MDTNNRAALEAILDDYFEVSHETFQKIWGDNAKVIKLQNSLTALLRQAEREALDSEHKEIRKILNDNLVPEDIKLPVFHDTGDSYSLKSDVEWYAYMTAFKQIRDRLVALQVGPQGVGGDL